MRTIAWILAAILVAGVAAGAGLWAWLDARARTPYRGYAPDARFVTVEPGSGVVAIGRRLVDAGVVEHLNVFRWAVWRRDAARRLQAGEYQFTRPMSPLDVVEVLVRGAVYLRPVTFPEGLTIPAMADLFEGSGFGDAGSFREAAREVGLVADLDSEATDLEGYLFPDTYALPRSATAAQVVRLMVSRFRDATGPGYPTAAVAAGLTVRQAVTLASLVEKETARAEERATVAAVYHNRLRRGMLLQCDPTVIYALEQLGRYDGNIRRADLSVDSPYNTYRYAGLPPGPIAAPGRAALEAAVTPADVEYLYFVSRNDGSHVFASTLREHNARAVLEPAVTPADVEYLYFVSRNDGSHVFASTLREHNANVREFQIRFFRERRGRD